MPRTQFTMSRKDEASGERVVTEISYSADDRFTDFREKAALDIEEMKQYQILAVMGKNGIGKSTLLRTLPGLYVYPEREGTFGYQNKKSREEDQEVAGSFEEGPTVSIEGGYSYGANADENSLRNYCQHIVSVFIEACEELGAETKVCRDVNDFLLQLGLILGVSKKRDEGNEEGTFLVWRKKLPGEVFDDPEAIASQILHIDGQGIGSRNSSSGEKNIILLAMQIALFFNGYSREFDPNIPDIDGLGSVLLLDEPDLHLHPEAQSHIAAWIRKQLQIYPDKRVIVATHSVDFLNALYGDGSMKVGAVFVDRIAPKHSIVEVTEPLLELLPLFASHRLNKQGQKKPILLVEGPDDLSLWGRLSHHLKLELHILSAKGKCNFPAYIYWANHLKQTLFNDAEVFLIKDHDNPKKNQTSETAIIESNVFSNVFIMVLNCYAIENMVFSDEVVAKMTGNLGASVPGLPPSARSPQRARWKNQKGGLFRWIVSLMDAGVRVAEEERGKAHPDRSKLTPPKIDWLESLGKSIKEVMMSPALPTLLSSLGSSHSIVSHLGRRLMYFLMSYTGLEIAWPRKFMCEMGFLRQSEKFIASRKGVKLKTVEDEVTCDIAKRIVAADGDQSLVDMSMLVIEASEKTRYAAGFHMRAL